MDGIRIKDLQSAEPIAAEQFDDFRFPLDAPKPNTTLHLAGAFFKRIFALLNGNRNEDFAARNLTAQIVDAKKVTADEILADKISSHEALAAMIGYGFTLEINPDTGKAELWVDGVHARDFFETLEMRYRKMIVSGEELVVNNGGVVSEVLPVGETLLSSTVGELIVSQEDEDIIWPLAAGEERITFVIKGETGIDYQMFVEDDILRYTWRDKDTGLKGASGYLRVIHALDEFSYTAEILEGSPEWLRAGMTLALFGNVTNPERQGFIVLSARERTIAIYDGVNSTKLSADNLKVLLGNLSGVVDPAFPEISGYGLYSQNCYLKGNFVLRSTGTTVESELETVRTDFETSFKVTDGLIEGVVKSVETIDNRVTTAESSIKQTAEEITSKVSNDTYNSYIKQTAEEIKLKATMIMVEGLLNVDGTIKTDALVCDGATITRLHAVSADIEGNITATSGRVGSLILGLGGDITSYLSGQSMLFSTDTSKAFIGKNIAPSTSGLKIPAWFESTHGDNAGADPNIALYLRATGVTNTTYPSNAGNHAIQIGAGDIAGFAVNTKRLYKENDNITLSHGVTMYACYNNGSEITINLPAPSATQIGKIFYVKQMYQNVRVNGTIYRLDPVDGVWLEDRIMATFINDGKYWHFAYSQA